MELNEILFDSTSEELQPPRNQSHLHQTPPPVQQHTRSSMPPIQQQTRQPVQQQMRPPVQQQMRPPVQQQMRPSVQQQMRPRAPPQIRPSILKQPSMQSEKYVIIENDYPSDEYKQPNIEEGYITNIEVVPATNIKVDEAIRASNFFNIKGFDLPKETAYLSLGVAAISGLLFYLSTKKQHKNHKEPPNQ